MIQRYEINIQGDPPTLGDPALIPNDNGNLLLYADAEKWVGEEIAALIEEGQEAACINNHNVEVASQEIAALKKRLAIDDPHPFGDDYDALDLARDRESAYKKEIATMKIEAQELHDKYGKLWDENAALKEALK